MSNKKDKVLNVSSEVQKMSCEGLSLRLAKEVCTSFFLTTVTIFCDHNLND